jgi:hypothetical protein
METSVERAARAAHVHIVDDASVMRLGEAVGEEAAAVGLDEARAGSLVRAAHALARDHLVRAGGGDVELFRVLRQRVPGLEIVARDRGTSIAELAIALRDARPWPGGSDAHTAAGLAGIYELVDELDVDVRSGEGTTIRARKFASPVARHEVAVVARAADGEHTNGDDALVLWHEDRLLLAVADGLGHGAPAREAASRALAAVGARPDRSEGELFEAAHAAALGTRGAVMSVARLDWTARELHHFGIGNVGSQLYGERGAIRFPASPGFFGAPDLRQRRPRVESAALEGRPVFVMFTDGVSSRVDLIEDRALLREPPLVIAHRVMSEHGGSHDDVLVLVAR